MEIPPDLREPFVSHLNALEIAISAYPMILDLFPAVLKCSNRKKFITSDNPVFVANLAGEVGRVPFLAALASPGLIITLPLDPRHILILFDPESYILNNPKGVRPKLVDSDVDKLNLLQFIGSRDALYFSEAQERFAEKFKSAENLRPQKDPPLES